MINGIEGIPGSGKSYEAVVFHVLPALQSGRKVITNLPLVLEFFTAINPDFADLIEIRKTVQPVLGTWDASRVDENGNGEAFQLFEDGHAEEPTRSVNLFPRVAPVQKLVDVVASIKPFGHVWDFYTTWKHPESGLGPLFIIDEAHVSLGRRNADPQVCEWFALHRHFNIDVLLMSQRFRKIHPDISELLAMLVRCRKADVMGKPDHYIRRVFSGYPGAELSNEERKYKPEFFGAYRSHTQGNSISEASAQDVAPFIVRFKRWTRMVWILFFVLAAIWLLWMIFRDDKPKAKPQKTVLHSQPVAVSGDQVHPTPQPLQKNALTAPSRVSAPADQPESTDGELPEPFMYKGLHVTGHMQMGRQSVYTFAISHNMIYVGSITSADLERIGYKWEPLTECVGSLTWKNRTRAVICDAPTPIKAVAEVQPPKADRPSDSPGVSF